MDIGGQKPELYLVSTNRTAGKTTFFGRWFIRRWLQHGEKFMLLYRYSYELADCVSKFWPELQRLFFQEHEMRQEVAGKGVYVKLYLDNVICGYAAAVNTADSIKKTSHTFADVQRMLFDEFQSETNHYCANEVQKFMSVHTSVARGGGEQVRYVPVYMLGNYVSILNPYYVALGVSHQLRSDTKFFRGDGFVIEHGFNETAEAAQKSSGFNRALSGQDYLRYSAQGAYLNDKMSFIEQVSGPNRYLATAIYKGAEYGIREYSDHGIIYVDNRPDKTFPHKIAVTLEDHSINYVILKKNHTFLESLRYFFNRGCFRFRNLSCKEMLMTMIAYR